MFNLLKKYSAITFLFFLMPCTAVIAASEYIGEKECYACHKDIKETYTKRVHGRIFIINPRNDLEAKGCEACHGPGKEHKAVADKEEKGAMMIEAFKKGEGQPASKACLQCHEKGARMQWQGGNHDMAGVACNDCHSIHSDTSAKNSCFTCHPQSRSQLQRSSHMPLREGKMDCTSCHNPHGASGPALLKTATVNETCYECHAEKRGPFIWEHAPVNENCALCHDPHGSNNPKLLVSQGSFLCAKCHTYGGHSSLLNAQFVSANISGGCVNCHSRIHGSNHPSGARFQR